MSEIVQFVAAKGPLAFPFLCFSALAPSPISPRFPPPVAPARTPVRRASNRHAASLGARLPPASVRTHVRKGRFGVRRRPADAVLVCVPAPVRMRKCAKTTMRCALISLAHGCPFSNASVRENREHRLLSWMRFGCPFACKYVKIVARQEGNRRLPVQRLFCMQVRAPRPQPRPQPHPHPHPRRARTRVRVRTRNRGLPPSPDSTFRSRDERVRGVQRLEAPGHRTPCAGYSCPCSRNVNNYA